jgi:hypothetical protein
MRLERILENVAFLATDYWGIFAGLYLAAVSVALPGFFQDYCGASQLLEYHTDCSALSSPPCHSGRLEEGSNTAAVPFHLL